MCSAKRKRCTNFNVTEVDALITLIEEFQGVIECKRTDHVTNSKKEAVWDKICEKFNNTTGTGRTKEHLKSKWDSLKKSTRKEFSEIKQGVKKTGGGPAFSLNLNSIAKRILGIIGISATGNSNKYDCDADDEPAAEPVLQDENDTTSAVNELMTTEVQTMVNTIVIDNVNVSNSEWKEWSPAMLKQPKNDLLIVPSQIEEVEVEVDEPLDAISMQNIKKNVPTPKKKDTYRPKRRNTCIQQEKQIFSSLAQKKIELTELQIKIIQEDHEQKIKLAKDEHELKQKFAEEKHLIEMEILNTELDLKRKQIEKIGKENIFFNE